MKTVKASNTAKITEMYSVEITRYFLSWEPNFGKSVKEAVKTVSSYDELLKLFKDTKDTHFAAKADVRIINNAAEEKTNDGPPFKTVLLGPCIRVGNLIDKENHLKGFCLYTMDDTVRGRGAIIKAIKTDDNFDRYEPFYNRITPCIRNGETVLESVVTGKVVPIPPTSRSVLIDIYSRTMIALDIWEGNLLEFKEREALSKRRYW